MTIKLIIAILASIAFSGALWAAHHAGYIAGQKDRIAYYEPLISAAYEAKSKAEDKVHALERGAAVITKDIEAKHADKEKALADREAAASVRIAQLLRQRSAATGPTGCGEVSGVPGSGAVTAGGTASRERDERFAGRVSRVGAQCEHDAAEVAGWQEWYGRQKSLSAAPAQ